MIIFGGFNGEYYNDLYYINVFELRTRLQIPSSNMLRNISKIVNDKKFSDVNVKTKSDEVFYLHRGLLMNGIKSEDLMDKLIQKIDGNLEKS